MRIEKDWNRASNIKMTWPTDPAFHCQTRNLKEGLREGRGLQSVCIAQIVISGIAIEMRWACLKLHWTNRTTFISQNLCNLTSTLVFGVQHVWKHSQIHRQLTSIQVLVSNMYKKKHPPSTQLDFLFPHNALACKASVARALRCPRYESILMAHRPINGRSNTPHWMII